MKLFISIVVLIVSFAALAAPTPDTNREKSSLCKRVGSQLQSADILFLDIDEYLFRKVAEATKSWTSHVGVAIQEEGQWVIYESVDPVSKKTPLCKFLERTREDHVAVRRMKKTPTAKQIAELTKFLQANMGKEYHFGFDYDSEKLFCSKLVYNAYKEIFNLELGEVKTFKKLLAENPDGKTWFWRLWFFGFIPWERNTVTPHDQLMDQDLATVLTWENQGNLVL